MEFAKCPKCHVEIRSTDYFCFNCGTTLKKKPPSLDVASQMWLYLKSALLPPFGIFWAIPYVKATDRKSKVVGIAAIAITLFVFFVSLVGSQKLMGQINQEINNQLNYGGLY